MWDRAAAVSLLADGKILLAGAHGTHFAQHLSTTVFGLARLDASGHPDAAFGDGGVVSNGIPIALAPGFDGGGAASAIALASEGRVVAAGATTLAFDLRVADTQTGLVRAYENALGNPAAAITDTEAFATCP